HPIHVAYLLTEAGVSDCDTLIAAILHDTIEDTNTTKAELESHFGSKITSIVLECTDDKSLPKAKRKQLQLELDHKSQEAKLVKLADKYSNLSDVLNSPPTNWSTEEIEGYKIWCFVIWQKLKGVNSKFDGMFTLLFNQNTQEFLTLS